MQNADEMLSLLLVIKRGEDFSDFLMKHLGFATVGKLCVEALESGLIAPGRQGYEITDKGILFINEMNDNLCRKGLDREIAKIPDALCPQISINSIYLPEKF